MSKLKPALIALSLMLVAPMAVQASEITGSGGQTADWRSG